MGPSENKLRFLEDRLKKIERAHYYVQFDDDLMIKEYQVDLKERTKEENKKYALMVAHNIINFNTEYLQKHFGLNYEDWQRAEDNGAGFEYIQNTYKRNFE